MSFGGGSEAPMEAEISPLAKTLVYFTKRRDREGSMYIHTTVDVVL